MKINWWWFAGGVIGGRLAVDWLGNLWGSVTVIVVAIAVLAAHRYWP
ncbi:MAG TPA: hypothetical protein VHT94_07295 [Streptosporangiaceae bacterium]|jgi:hypothetical protein|nr:hypothetical protein [Streptosporangiaceae bacterium]